MNFISIGSDCSCLGYLGDGRIRGPIDNVISKSSTSFTTLFDGSVLDQIINNPPLKVWDKKPQFPTDSAHYYIYESFIVSHNDVNDKFKKEFLKRYENFKEIYKHIQEPGYYFTKSLREELDKENHVIKEKQLLECIEALKNLNILDKTIFITTKLDKEKNFWNFWAKDFEPYVKKYNLNWIEIIDNMLHRPHVAEQFQTKVNQLLAVKGVHV